MKRPSKLLVLVGAISIAAAACSAPTGSDPTTAHSSTSSAVPQSPEGSTPSTDAPPTGGSDSSTSSTDAPKPPPDGPVAPNFTMALESGGSFTLSDAAKPVYMVFWAEW